MGKPFFKADDGVHGFELWVSDSTEAGTHMIKDINPGSGDGIINSVSVFTRLDSNHVLFTASDGVHGFELWITDGTESGTFMLKDIFPQNNSSSSPANFTIFNNKLFFTAGNSTNGNELWVTDGTVAGTVLFKDITGNGLSSTPTGLTVVGNKMFFAAQDTTANGNELWMTDGTPTGTVMVKNINTTSNNFGSSDPTELTESNGKLYFVANDGVHGFEAWVSDGTAAGTMMLKDILAGSTNTFPTTFTAYKGLTYFRAQSSANVYDIYVTDGTPAGTSLFYKLNASGTSITQPKFVTMNNLLYFTGNNGVSGAEIYRTDGTVAGTQMVKDINGLVDSSIIGKIFLIRFTPLTP